MTLIRWNPLRDVTAWHPANEISPEFAAMQRELDHAFNRFLGGTMEDNTPSHWMPPVDIAEREKDYTIKIELPGVEKNDVKITIQKDVLTIRGEKKQEGEEKSGNYQRIERCYGSFQRSFTLPTSVSSDKIEASYDNGVLTINLPKVEEARPKEVEVKVK